MHKKPAALAWSGGKDSAMALAALRSDPGVDVVALVTTMSREYDRISIHGVRRSVLEAQVAALGIPRIEVSIPAPASIRAARTANSTPVSMPDRFLRERLRCASAIGFCATTASSIAMWCWTNCHPRDGEWRVNAPGCVGLPSRQAHRTEQLSRHLHH